MHAIATNCRHKARTQDETDCSQNNEKSPWMATTLTMLLLQVADFRATVSRGGVGRMKISNLYTVKCFKNLCS